MAITLWTGRSQLGRLELGTLYTIPEKKRIDIIAPDGTDVLKMTFNDAESYFKKLDEYVKMLIER